MTLDREHSIFPHACTHEGCKTIVQYDDEPWCFTHSPDEGSHITGWSARSIVETLWTEYGEADRLMASLAHRTDDEGRSLHTAARQRTFDARAELERVGAWK